MHEIGREEADELVGFVLQEVLHRGRDVAELARVAEDHRHVRGVLDQRTEPVLAQAEMGLGLLLLRQRLLVLLHDGAGHVDDEIEDEATHHIQGGRRRLAQFGLDPALIEADLADDHADEAPDHHGPPDARTGTGHVLQSDEDVRGPQHRAPPREVDDQRDRRYLADHPKIESDHAPARLVDAIHHHIEGGDADEHAQPHPPSHMRHVAEPHEDHDHDERDRPDQVWQLLEIGELLAIQPIGRRRSNLGFRPISADGLTRTILRSQRHVPCFVRSAQPPSIDRLGGDLIKVAAAETLHPTGTTGLRPGQTPSDRGARHPKKRRPASSPCQGMERRARPPGSMPGRPRATTPLRPRPDRDRPSRWWPPALTAAAGSLVRHARPRHGAPAPVRGCSDGP